HGAKPGARAEMVYVPPSTGAGWFQPAGLTGSLPRSTSSPATWRSAGTAIVSLDSRGSGFFAWRLAGFRGLGFFLAAAGGGRAGNEVVSVPPSTGRGGFQPAGLTGSLPRSTSSPATWRSAGTAIVSLDSRGSSFLAWLLATFASLVLLLARARRSASVKTPHAV